MRSRQYLLIDESMQRRIDTQRALGDPLVHLLATPLNCTRQRFFVGEYIENRYGDRRCQGLAQPRWRQSDNAGAHTATAAPAPAGAFPVFQRQFGYPRRPACAACLTAWQAPCSRGIDGHARTYPFYRVTRIAGLYAQCLDHELKPRGMDQPRSRVLMLLSEHSPSAMGELAEKTVMKLPTLLKLVQRMAD